MSLITSPEFFINMKSYPQKGDRDYDDFILYELDKIEYGVTINGTYISGWLYWHLNHWQTYIPTIDLRSGDVKDEFINPSLRDNEWLVAENLEKAREQKSGLILIGGRRIAKTSMVSSWLGMHATIYQGSQNVIVGNNKGDIRNITLQMDKGLSSITPFLKHDRLLDDWGKEVELGVKEKKVGGARYGFSNIYIRNTEEGVKTEVLAGLTPKSLVYDEVGKAPTKEAFMAGMKAFASPYGWRCIPIMTGTGGDFTRGKDAEEIFLNPERFNMLAIEVPNETRKTGIFMSGHYSVDHPKDVVPLSQFVHAPVGSELDEIKIAVTNFDRADKEIEDELERWKKSNDPKGYLKAKMYSPRTVDECFISNVDENPFPVDALKQHLVFLQHKFSINPPDYVTLYRGVDSKVVSKPSRLLPVAEYPVKKDTLKDAPVVIYEHPVPNPPSFLYIAGADPYNTNASDTSPSLGTVYVFKRTYDPIGGTYQKRIVASYSARPETMKEWHETAEMLLEYYNATCMIELIGTNFIQYMENKNKLHYLADGFNLAKELNPRSMSRGQSKGLPATSPIQTHYKNLSISYLTDPLPYEMNKETGEMDTVMGLTRIDDPMLLTEYINYRETEFKKGGGNKKKGNFDRYVAFGHVLTYDEHLEKIAPLIKVIEETPIEQKREKITRSPFYNTTVTPFGAKRRNPF